MTRVQARRVARSKAARRGISTTGAAHGGRVVALEITQPTLPGFTPIFRVYFHHVVPWVGQLVGSDREAYTYLPQSVDRFLPPGELSKLMERIGLRAVTYRRLGMGTVTVHTGIA